MARIGRLTLACAMLASASGHAQSVPGAAPLSHTVLHRELLAGTHIQFSTADELSSRRQAKGDHIALKTVGDTVEDGQIVIPANSAAIGEISDSRGTGGLGVSGKLSISPLYMTVQGITVRLTGLQIANRGAGAETVIGVALLLPVSGKTAVVPAGTRVEGTVLHTVSLPVVAP